MARPAPKHGTVAGYKAELAAGIPCERCRAANRVYNRQFSKKSKAQGVKYGYHQVLDHLDDRTEPYRTGRKPNRTGREPDQDYAGLSANVLGTPENSPEPGANRSELSGNSGKVQAEGPLYARLGAALGDRVSRLASAGGDGLYVPEDVPGYLADAAKSTPKDAEPEGEWASVIPDEFVLGPKDMRLIEENMGTYASVLGMTLEMIDPYCGPIFADNVDNIVKRWSKVVARYPRAAKLFMTEGGGTVMDWIGALQATWPLLFAVYEHHLTGAVKTEGGKVFRVVSEGASGVDATMPPSPQEYDFTTR